MTTKCDNQPNAQEKPQAECQRNGSSFTPRVDIYETETEFRLLVEVPGVKPEGVDLNFERGELRLHATVAEAHQPSGKGVREYRVGNYQRAFQLPDSIDSTKIDAECRQGLLTVHLPKVAAVQPKQVQIRGE